ncbi:MAG: tetratricopeptide repeat protein [Bdellovibrionales bacterium]|nr:tetratricopeptide repeat protein [Massilia sp.]
MKNAFIIVTLSGLMAACAVAPSAAPPLAAAPVEPLLLDADAPAGPSADELAAAEEARLPKVQLTSELLYKLMKAELDFKNGTWQGPYNSMLAAARQTRDPRLARRAAEMALNARQSGESMAAVRLWRELAPGSEEAAEYYLGMAVLSDDLGEAEKIFARKLREASPKARGVAMFQVQQYLERATNKPAASLLLDKLLAPYADAFEARVLLAQNAFARGDAATAVRQAQAAVALKPDSEIAVLTLAQVTADQDAVVVLLEKFMAAYPKAREVRLAHARVLVSQKRYPQARKAFETMLAEQPDNAGALYALGIMSIQLSDSAAAENYFTRFIDLLDKSPDEARDPGKVLVILSQLAEERGDYKAASRWLEKVGQDEPDNYFAAQLKRARLVAKQGDTDGAIKQLGLLKASAPAEQAQVVSTQAQVLREAGRNEAAFAALADGAKRFPANPDLLYDYALMAEKTGRIELMETSLRAVMQQAPDNHHAYNALGYSLAERNVRLPEALALIQKAMAMAPDDPFIMDSMGWVQYRLGNLDQAEAHLRRAYALRGDVDIAVHLGEVLWHKGLKADAQKLWREARAKDPRNDTLKSTLARLQPGL